jgi:type II secretory pathway component GspD/PulD (secretin)
LNSPRPGKVVLYEDNRIGRAICVVPLKGIGAAQLVPILRPLLPSYGHLAALPDRNALLIVDRSANVRRLVEIIKTFENLPKAVELPASKSQ